MYRWISPSHLNFLFGTFLAVQIGLFLYFESTPGVTDRQDRIRGRDFLHFYLAGRLVAEKHTELLYQQENFIALQKSISPITEQNPPYISVYPPHSALLFSPLSTLPYPRAIECWWVVQLCCTLLAAYLLLKQLYDSLYSPDGTAIDSKELSPWRFTAWLGIFAFYPVINTFWNGQLSALLFLCITVGLLLHQQQRYTLAGLALSLLSLKPQIALGIYLWLVIRGDWRTLLGVALGGLVQLGIVAGTLGQDVIIQYVHNTKLASAWYAIYTMSPDHQHALAGILTTWFGNDFSRSAMIAQGILACVSGYFLWQLRRTPFEYAAAIVFALNCAPHLLTYDLCYVLFAVGSLLALYQHENRLLHPIIILYGSAMVAPLYVITQVSLVPVAMMLVLVWLFLLHYEKQKQGSLQ